MRILKDNELLGIFKFFDVKLFSGSLVIMEDEIEMKIVVGFLNVKFYVVLEVYYLDIIIFSLDVEIGGLFSVVGDNKVWEVVFVSEKLLFLWGVGVGYVSNGGSGYGGVVGGFYYGFFYYLKEFGCRGGNGIGSSDIGGSGGGYVKIEVGILFINDGIIMVEGGSVIVGRGVGGGSGGSFLF